MMDIEMGLEARPRDRLLEPSVARAVAHTASRALHSQLKYQPFDQKIEEIKPHPIEYTAARFEYLKSFSSEDTVCCGVTLNITKCLYQLMSSSTCWLVFAYLNTFVSQAIRVYLLVDLVQIIFNSDAAEDWLFALIFLSRVLYFLTIFRAGLVKSQLGSLEIVMKSYMKNSIQREED
jgi:hypothetical protein